MNFLQSDSSTPDVLIKLGLDVKIRSMQEEDSLVIWIGWSIN